MRNLRPIFDAQGIWDYNASRTNEVELPTSLEDGSIIGELINKERIETHFFKDGIVNITRKWKSIKGSSHLDDYQQYSWEQVTGLDFTEASLVIYQGSRRVTGGLLNKKNVGVSIEEFTDKLRLNGLLPSTVSVKKPKITKVPRFTTVLSIIFVCIAGFYLYSKYRSSEIVCKMKDKFCQG